MKLFRKIEIFLKAKTKIGKYERGWRCGDGSRFLRAYADKCRALSAVLGSFSRISVILWHFPSAYSPQVQYYYVVTFCFSDSPPLVVGQEHHPYRKGQCIVTFEDGKEKILQLLGRLTSGLSRELRQPRTLAQRVAGGVAGGDWGFFTTSGSSLRETKVEDEFSSCGG